jgi:hypothetical protein
MNEWLLSMSLFQRNAMIKTQEINLTAFRVTYDDLCSVVPD